MDWDSGLKIQGDVEVCCDSRYTDAMPRTLTREEYLADEIGTIRKDHGGKLRVALAYPNSYAVGMSNIGFHAIYHLLNARDDVVCERLFLPEVIRPRSVLRTLESNTPLSEMDVIAFSVSFELDYPNIPRMLRMGGVEPFAERRNLPLVIAGGATMTYNPEPLAPFLDAVVIGEAEEIIAPLADALIAALHGGSLDPLAALPGVYLPARGTTDTPRLLVKNLNRIVPHTAIYSPHTEFGNMTLLEVGRGCPYGCRFCVASHVYRPARWRSAEALLPVIADGLDHRNRVGLIGASVTDHPQILTLCEEILRRGGKPSPASMRADALTDELLALLARGGVRTITLAPEAGREPLRRAVGKTLSDEALFSAAERAKRAGIPNLKLYFIVGLSGETDEDIAAIPALATQLARESGMSVSVGCSVFVPKPGTPFARAPMILPKEAKKRLDQIQSAMRREIDMTKESPRWAFWQGVLARGGRELAPALAAIAEGKDTPAAWEKAFRAHGILAEQYALQAIPPDAPLPWAHIGGSRCSMSGE